ncbi:RsbRD N-terminal domain-containing protein [Geomobilimonas luticola]|uniref:RsbRD N-terminal domain-containing protein n=1 Tax=Geomobilimonas luticola TaxID=1114878 RepID=A0ABS5S7V1_9BACT|nr:RsbRD N-terminal domain-containing protein [Geomobilimonas luticola]MBT0651441.1 RsbRD N-terminal domain-containing protein [Geomobilimonas luticola]
MRTEDAILERWFARAVEAYPGETVRFLTAERDQFRNPVGHVLRENLAVLLRELLGGMEPSRTKPALEAIIRVRAVQELTATQAVEFVFALRSVVGELAPEHDALSLGRKVDQLALMAFDEYVRCREKMYEIRLNESRRALSVPAAMARMGS